MPPSEPHKQEERVAEKSVDQRIADLEAALAASRAGSPLSLLPEHSAGEGTSIAPTWSQAEQEAATADTA